MPRLISEWTVDYGQGPTPCTVPHAWRQDVDVRWEGPAIYRTTVEVPEVGGWLVFRGVSYQAKVAVIAAVENHLSPLRGERSVRDEPGEGSLNPRDEPLTPPPLPLERGEGILVTHHGIWDAFTVPLAGFEGQFIEVEVEVVKNGGPTFPVRDVASGFLPFVFNTFGGIWQVVELWVTEPDLTPPAPPCRVSVKGTKIFVDGKPFYLRGVLTWGWYPELGNHPCPDDETIRREVRLMKELGFNTAKFCLWVPSHRYFEILEEEGMFAWLELPLWDPTPDPEKQEAMFEELRRITLQYRRHSNILVWTCGCELSSNTSAEFRRRLYEMVKGLTGAALVKDNSGSSEMYGGDLREYGDFYDFHPYCDLPFYPVVLDSLLIGPREKKPILLGEFNDIDVHRDLPRVKREQPFWASEDPFLNDQGVRWEPPQLPRILNETKWGEPGATGYDDEFAFQSLEKAGYLRWRVQEAVRARDEISGYVITGWRDTPISTSGVVDDWGVAKEEADRIRWNRSSLAFPIPIRRPPWVQGGNRPGWIDPDCIFEGHLDFQVGVHSESPIESQLNWHLVCLGQTRPISQGQSAMVIVEAYEPTQVGSVHVDSLPLGSYVLAGEFSGIPIIETIEVVAKPDFGTMTSWGLQDPSNKFFGVALKGSPNLVTTEAGEQLTEALRSGSSTLLFGQGFGSFPAPHWREAAFHIPSIEQSDECPTLDWPLIPSWSQFHCVSGDRVIDLDALRSFLPELTDVQVLINRVDTRTYAEAPILIRAKVGKGTLVATTLRPFGGLGCQPYGVMNNPAGADLLVKLMKLAEEG